MISIEDNIRVNPDHERLFYRNNVEKKRSHILQKKQTSLERCLLFIICDPVGIRTRDPQLRRLLLYPAELPDHHLYY